MIDSTMIEWKNGIIDVSYEIEAGCEGSVDQYGQKNEPDTPAELYIHNIYYMGLQITDLFDEDDLEAISEFIWDEVNSRSDI